MFESLTDLRLVLLLLGVVLILLIYLWGRHRARKDDWELPPDADLSGEPVLPEETKPEDEWDIIPLHAKRDDVDEGALESMRGIDSKNESLDDDDVPTLTDVIGTVKPPKAAPKPAPKPLAEIVVVLTIIAKPGKTLSGTSLLVAANRAGLNYGSQRIFHRMSDNTLLFSMANILEPGIFDLNAMDKFTTPGVALFARLPARAAGSRIIDAMIETARTLAKLLDADICDERRAVVTEEGFKQLQDKARPYSAVSGK